MDGIDKASTTSL